MFSFMEEISISWLWLKKKLRKKLFREPLSSIKANTPDFYCKPQTTGPYLTYFLPCLLML